jgi:hypothetical protein
MDQGSDHIRQNIESTRAALDEKLDTLETKARETFDLRHQVAERPWMALGAAVAAGFVLGSMGGGSEEQRWHGQPATTVDYNQHSGHTPAGQDEKSSLDSFLGQFDDEIDMLKGAAISTLTNFLHETIRAYVPAMGQHLSASSNPEQGRTPSTATNASYSSGADRAGFDSPPSTSGQSSQLSNAEVGGSTPYYPPGSAGVENRDYVKTYHPPEEARHERSVGDETRF